MARDKISSLYLDISKFQSKSIGKTKKRGVRRGERREEKAKIQKAQVKKGYTRATR